VLLAFAVLAGLSLYIMRFIADGSKWASHPSNITVSATAFHAGELFWTATALFSRRPPAESGLTQKIVGASVNAARRGDLEGNIGTGALMQFASGSSGKILLPRLFGTGEERRYLSIDAGLNVTAYKALNGKKGAVGVMNYKTGEILCMVSAPSYDPNNKPDFNGNPDKYEGVYINRFLSGVYTPGSIFKLVTLAAAVENIPDLRDRAFRCAGRLNVGGELVTDTDKHGEIGIEDALAVSCNTVFGELSLELGGDTLKAYAERFGLTSQVVIDGMAAAKGNFDAAEAGTADLAGPVSDSITIRSARPACSALWAPLPTTASP
jgi:peptidoglycan glycosyltransferase